jgi:hypothetical protein
LATKVIRLTLLAAAVVTSTTCDSASGPAHVALVQVTPGSWNPTALGDTVRFTAAAKTNLRTTIPDLPITWSSDAPGVVFVGEDGSAVAHESGTARIRATIDEVTGSATVTVVQTIASVEILTYFGNTVAAGDSIWLYVDARDRNAYSVPGARFTLLSLKPSVATITLEGWVKGVSPGEASIVAMAAGKADTALVQVHP